MVLCRHVFMPAFPAWGSAGVDIFFPISGLVMVITTYGIRGEPGAARRFLWRRLWRIAPLYWLATLAMWALLPKHFELETVLHSLFFLPINPHGPDNSADPVLVPGWTLNIEMLFYLIFAVALALPKSLTYPMIAGAIAALIGLGLVLPKSSSTWYLCNPLMLEFLFGVGIGLVYMRGFRIETRWIWLAVPPLALFLTTMFAEDHWRLLTGGIPCALIVAIAALGPALKSRALEFAGDCSYALYLTHVLVIVVLGHFGTPPWIMFFAALAVAVPAHLLERRLLGFASSLPALVRTPRQALEPRP
jgi:exopolysaccharide production protein ExoZ